MTTVDYNEANRKLAALLGEYVPVNQQEAADKAEMIRLLKTENDLWTRNNPNAHLTASAWVVSPDRSKVLMCYHKVYDSWSWLGGHADGQTDLLQVALKEVREESGLENVTQISNDIISLEILTVDGHEKNGRYVSSHLHLNVTYLIQADPGDALKIKDDENSNLAWFSPEEAVKASSEPWFRERIYPKLNRRI